MYIRKLEPIQKAKVKICLSDGADFVLYKKEADTLGLREEQELSQELYQRILDETLLPRARKRALHLLEQMDRSEEQLRSKLRDNGYPREAIEDAIAYVSSYHYIDDERLTRSYIRYYQQTRSRMRICQDLMRKGISRDLIDFCMETEYTADEYQQILQLLEKKHYNSSSATRQEQGKMYRFLQQRGFRSSEIHRALAMM
jgi:regulatory protein